MELTAQQIIELCPMKIELVSDRKICLLSDLKLGNVFFENIRSFEIKWIFYFL